MISVIFAFTLCGLLPAFGQFTPGPTFSVGTVPCDQPYHKPEDICRELTKAFAFTFKGVGWEASKGLITDGASIPRWGRGLVGEPFAEEFAKAATLHDHYTRPEHRVRDYLATHRMFYDALIETGLDWGKAGVMYAAVVVAGPKWSVLVPGEDCDLVNPTICVKNAGQLYTAVGVDAATDEIEAVYTELPMEQLVGEFATAIAAGNLSPEQIEQMALTRRIMLGYSLPSLYAVQE